ncbi:uncharacterized protein LOC111191279 [Astyanax mexicanus]|uniref:uncharacterized protein LOC111191279 n=1 Tax=Astyanax mexicanus TaxID=7994 RepID=UPI0020CB2F4E|nr:uncharacterized protein LOC111191279 [Astyanax mexicanus]
MEDHRDSCNNSKTSKNSSYTFSWASAPYLLCSLQAGILFFGLLNEICAEFHRITNVNLKNHFYAELDRHAPHLLSLFRIKAGRAGKVSEVLCQLFRIYDLQEQVDVHVRRAAVLRALPAYLHEDDCSFLKTWNVSQSDEPDIDDMPIGLLSISANSTDATPLCPERIAVVLEGNIVIEHPTLADAFVTLFGLMYALHLSYPKELANTFDFTQKVLMGLEDGKLRPRVLTLKNELLAVE